MASRLVKSQGWILVQMLLFSLICLLIILQMLESNLLQTKMNQNFKIIVNARVKAWKHLKKVQQSVSIKCVEIKYPLIQFVPDTLHWGEQEGVSFYRIEIDHDQAGAKVHLNSVFATRCLQEPMHKSFEIEYLKEKHAMRFWVLASLKDRDTLDTIYFINHNNQLIKLIKDLQIPEHWQMLYSQNIPWKVLDAPLIGYATKAEAMVYLVVEQKQGNQSVIAILDNLISFQGPIFTISLNHIESKPLLRQHYLVITEQGLSNRINVYHALTGQYIRSCEIKQHCIKEIIPETFKPLKVIERGGKAQPYIEIQHPDCIAGCFLELDGRELGNSVVRYVH